MNEMTGYAITAVNKARYAFCKFISANDVGATGAHQAGFYIPKNCWPLMFDAPGIKGTNKDRFIKIRWQMILRLLVVLFIMAAVHVMSIG